MILTYQIDIYADDYDYIPIDQLYMYNAYNIWFTNGYKADYTNTISYDENLTGTYTYTGTVNGSISGSESGSMNITLTGTLNTSNGEGGSTSSFNQFFAFDDISLEITSSENEQTNTVTYGCTFSNPNTSVGAYSSATCTPNLNYTSTYLPPLTVEVQDTAGSEAVSLGNIYLYLAEQETGGGTYSGILSLSESSSVNGSGTLSLSGTSSTTGHKIYDIPSLKVDNLIDINNIGNRISLNNDYIFSFLTTTSGFTPGTDIYLYTTNEDANISYETINARYIGGYILYTVKFNTDKKNSQYYIHINKKYNNVIPIYANYIFNMNDDIYRFIFNSNRTDELIDQGTTQSQEAANNLASGEDQFNQAANDFHDYEQDFKDNLDNSLEDINTDFSDDLFNPNRHPFREINWVKTQFDNLVSYQPIKLVLVYSLTIGIALTILGKLRNK